MSKCGIGLLQYLGRPPPPSLDKIDLKNGQGKVATSESLDGAFTLLVDEIAVILLVHGITRSNLKLDLTSPQMLQMPPPTPL